MILNKMQKDVLSSTKRIIVVTAQAGAGSTTALLYKLADEASKNKNNLGIFVKRSQLQVMGVVQSFLRNNEKSRYSPESKILTFKYNGKKVKIKMLSYEDLNLEEYIPVVAVDIGSHFKDLNQLIDVSGKIIISDFISNLEEKDSWGYESGLLKDVNGSPSWKICVDHIKGLQSENLGLPKGYIDYIRELSEENFNKLMKIDF